MSTDPYRHVEAAYARFDRANESLDSWARVIALDAVSRGPLRAADIAAEDFIIARAERFEAHADWQDARERWLGEATA